MDIHWFPLICPFLLTVSYFPMSHAHGRLIEPPSRASMWRYGFDTPINYNDNELFCGGFSKQWMDNGGNCGVCGDDWSLPSPRPHEAGGLYGTGTIARTYTQGHIIDVTVEMTASHLGWFEFRLCPHNDPSTVVTQACLDQNLLTTGNGTTRFFGVTHTALYSYNLRLPASLTCTQCVLQWKYHTGNSWGVDPDGTQGLGKGPQEEFYGCADIAVLPSIDNTSSTKPTGSAAQQTTISLTTSTTTTTTTTTPATSTTSGPTSTTSAPTTTATTEATTTTTITEPTTATTTEPTTTTTTTTEATTTTTSEPTATTSAQRITTTRAPTNTAASAPTSTTSEPTTTTSVQTSTISAPPTTALITETTTASTTPETNAGSQCHGAGVYVNVPGIDEWCRLNCQAGYCPPSHCQCTSTDSRTPETNTGTQCRGAGAYVNVPGIDTWCRWNCQAGYCPSSHCQCS